MEYLVADGLRPGIGRFGSCTKSNNRFGSWSIYKYVPSIKSMVSPTRNWSIVHVPTRMKCIVTNMFIYNHPLIFHKWTHIMLSQVNVILPTTVFDRYVSCNLFLHLLVFSNNCWFSVAAVSTETIRKWFIC